MTTAIRMMTGLTNSVLGDDHAPQEQLSAAASETAPSEATVDSNLDAPSPDSWRVEVAARLERYRTRRKARTPRYPSLLLPFDAPESWSRSVPPAGSGLPAVATAPDDSRLAEPRQQPEPAAQPVVETSAKVIEFPRSAAIPVFHPSNLADPVFDRDRPRIVEAPEILPPPPALGGMLIESAQRESTDRRADSSRIFTSAFPSASIVRRALAALVDGAVLAMSVAAFAAIFLRLNPTFNPGLNSLRLNLRHLNPLRLNDVSGPLLLCLPVRSAWSRWCCGPPTSSCLWCTPARLPDFVPLVCGWRDLTAQRPIGVCADGACWRRFFPRFPLDSATSGAFSTKMDCAGTTASLALTCNRQREKKQTPEKDDLREAAASTEQ